MSETQKYHWVDDGSGRHPESYRHSRMYQRETFKNGQCIHTERCKVWLLDHRDFDGLIARWNRQPTSEVTGIGYHFTPIY